MGPTQVMQPSLRSRSTRHVLRKAARGRERVASGTTWVAVLVVDPLGLLSEGLGVMAVVTVLVVVPSAAHAALVGSLWLELVRGLWLLPRCGHRKWQSSGLHSGV